MEKFLYEHTIKENDDLVELVVTPLKVLEDAGRCILYYKDESGDYESIAKIQLNRLDGRNIGEMPVMLSDKENKELFKELVDKLYSDDAIFYRKELSKVVEKLNHKLSVLEALKEIVD